MPQGPLCVVATQAPQRGTNGSFKVVVRAVSAGRALCLVLSLYVIPIYGMIDLCLHAILPQWLYFAF